MLLLMLPVAAAVPASQYTAAPAAVVPRSRPTLLMPASLLPENYCLLTDLLPNLLPHAHSCCSCHGQPTLAPFSGSTAAMHAGVVELYGFDHVNSCKQ